LGKAQQQPHLRCGPSVHKHRGECSELSHATKGVLAQGEGELRRQEACARLRVGAFSPRSPQHAPCAAGVSGGWFGPSATSSTSTSPTPRRSSTASWACLKAEGTQPFPPVGSGSNPASDWQTAGRILSPIITHQPPCDGEILQVVRKKGVSLRFVFKVGDPPGGGVRPYPPFPGG